MIRSCLINLLRFNLQGVRNIQTTPLRNVQLCRTIPIINSCRCITNVSEASINQLDKEKTYLVKIKDDPDSFGPPEEKIEVIDEGDLKEEEYLECIPDPSQRLSTKKYADIIKSLIRKRKLKKAIDILEIRMLKEDKVKPESYIYNLLLGACGRVGYTKKAFSLYNKMKQRGLKPMGGTYTALFNACANSPWPEDGLQRAKHLRNIMIEKRYEPNDTNYNAMIKAFGRCGDITTAFELVDEMMGKKMSLNASTLNFLLQSCISDKEAGFRHALLAWRIFARYRIIPDVYSYNLLLKCVKECNFGDLEVTKDVLEKLTKQKIFFKENEEELVLIAESDKQKDVETIKNDEQHTKTTEALVVKNEEIVLSRPNLLGRTPHLGNIISLSEVTKAEDRFLLLGGLWGFLKDMHDNNCTPDIKTFTQLLELIPSTTAMEKELLTIMKKLKVRLDTDFYNILIKKRSMRFDYEGGKEVLAMMKQVGLLPDIVTYGVLALGCKTKEEAESLIEEMKQKRFRMNPEILGAMLRQACCRWNFSYVLEMMEICLREEIRPNKMFMDHLVQFKRKCKHVANDPDNEMGKTTSFQKGFKVFKMRYHVWKTQVDPINEKEIHPWQQFREDTETEVKNFKDKEAKSRFKPRHSSKFRQKKQETTFERNINFQRKSKTRQKQSNETQSFIETT